MTHHLATAFVDFCVAFIALSSKNAPASRPMSLVAVSMGCWSLELFILGSVADFETLNTLFHITRWGMFLIPPSLTLLTWYLIGNKSIRFLYAVIIPGFATSVLLCILNFFVFPSELERVIDGYQPKPDAIYNAFSLLFIACLISCIALGIKRFNNATHREKQRIKWLLIVLLGTLSLGLLSMLLLRYPFYLKLVGATINMLFIGLLFYATIQHHLMDIKAAMSVGLVKAAAVAVILWGYFFINSLFEQPSDATGHIVIMAVFVYLVLEIYPKYRDWALLKTKKLVSRMQYDHQTLKQNSRLMLEASFDSLAFGQVLHYIFSENMNLSSYYSFSVNSENNTLIQENFVESKEFIKDSMFNENMIGLCRRRSGFTSVDECEGYTRESLEKNDILGFISINYQDRLLMVILLGRPLDEDYYSYDDLVLFEWLSAELGPTIVKISKIDEVHNDLNDAKKTLSLLDLMNHYHHDIKAPLSIIDGVISNNVYDNDKQNAVVLEQVSRIQKLITTMASVFQGHRSRKEQPVVLTDLLIECITVFDGQIDSVDYDINEIPKIWGDKEDLKILFINLIKNAIEAAAVPGAVYIRVKSWLDVNRPCISIQDNGIGMSNRHVDNLFLRAYSTKPNGSGIGMQAVKRILNEHHAEVEVLSKEGAGSTFIIRFPPPYDYV
ncbi:sensor histidine kinase [Agarilytica rhodophyticola]|uniref:sensor histidine kinase n=1 Tax=Agarilytica rhodophyticola TaxID=1737490 RepID=UPI000B343D28|nr:HAMP domain-containing sensor histidine kinase [Agarilytica rhodophyticola]